MDNALLELAEGLDPAAIRTSLETTGRAQVAPFLTDRSARRVRSLLEERTPWGLVWRAGGMDAPELIRAEQLGAVSADHARSMQQALIASMAAREYAFCYATYPLVQALLEGWAPGGPHEQLLTELNSPEVLDFIRDATGDPSIIKGDGQATLYRPGNFLARHNDNEPEQGRRVAYVLNLCGDPDGAPWRPEWGAMLQFLRDDGEPEETLLPRFNALNLFSVPRLHHVTSAASFAPPTRFAVTGWFRDR